MPTKTNSDSDISEKPQGSLDDDSNELDRSDLRAAEDPISGKGEEDKTASAPEEPSMYNASGEKKSFINRNKKQLLVASGVSAGAITIILIAFFLLTLLGPLKTVHFATVLRSIGFARFNLYTRRVYARTTFDAAVLTSDSTGNFKLEKRSLTDKLKRVNPEKQLRVLGGDDSLRFKFEGSSTFGGIRKTNDFKGVQIKGKDITLDAIAKQSFPAKGTYDKLGRTERWTVESQFVKQAQSGLADRLSVENRAFRSSVYNGFRQAAGISMVKWVNRAKEFAGKTPAESKKLNLQETEAKIGSLGVKSGITELNDEADKYKQSVIAAAESGKPTGEIKPITKLNGKINDASFGVFLLTAACIVHDLSKSVDQAKAQRSQGALQMGHDVLTTGDQIKRGDTVAEAVGAENSRWDGAENSVLYKQATGATITAADTKQLTTIPTTDPKTTFGTVIGLVNGVVDTIQFGGIPGLGTFLKQVPGVGNVVTGIQDAECSVVLNQYVQYGIAGTEIIVAVGSAGAEKGIAEGIRVALQGALKFAGTIGLGELLGSLIDSSIKNIAGTEYSGIQTGSDLYSQSAVGVEALAQPGNRQITYGRHLSSQEAAGSQQLAMSEDKAYNADKSFSNRYLAVNNPQSLVGNMAAMIPTNFSTLFVSSRNLMLHLGTLLTSPAQLIQKFANIVVSTQPAFAATTTGINGGDFGIDENGWSNAELNRIDTDPSFSGKDLAAFVEPQYDALFSKYSPCFSYELQSQKPGNCDNLLSPNDSNYEESLRWRAYMAESYAADSLSTNLGTDSTQ